MPRARSAGQFVRPVDFQQRCSSGRNRRGKTNTCYGGSGILQDRFGCSRCVGSIRGRRGGGAGTGAAVTSRSSCREIRRFAIHQQACNHHAVSHLGGHPRCRMRRVPEEVIGVESQPDHGQRIRAVVVDGDARGTGQSLR